MKTNFIDLTGQRFGKLMVIHKVENNSRHICYLCRCDCGKERIVQGNHLIEGSSTSCRSCYNARNSRLYRSVWIGMKQRCYNPKSKDYHNYGGRGIKVCDEWLGEHGFENFRGWAYANGYDDNAEYGKCTIDRIDVNSDYSPENCRWVDLKTQNQNKTTTHEITYQGETHTIAEWARITGISENALYNRVNRNWDLDRIFSQKVRGSRV